MAAQYSSSCMNLKIKVKEGAKLILILEWDLWVVSEYSGLNLEKS